MGLLGGIKSWVMPDEMEVDSATPASGATANSRVKIRIETPRDFSESAALLADLRANSCIVVNFNECDVTSRQRLYDFLDGARTFAGGTIAQIAEEVYMFSLTDSSVEKKFTGQSSAFQVEELKKRYLS